MIITCPSCSSRYKVDPAKFGDGGRKVRCSNCDHVWRVLPPDDLPRRLTAEPSLSSAGAQNSAMETGSGRPGRAGRRTEAVARPASSGRPGQKATGRRSRAGWVALVVFMAALVAGVVLGREAVVQAWPPAARLYSALGLQPALPGAGLDIRITSHDRTVVDDRPVLVVRGEVTNTTGDVVTVPKLEAVLRDGEGARLRAWTFAAAQTRLLPGETAPFSTQIEEPPSGAAALNIDFVGGGQ